jgi:hypothetical protein
MHAAITIVMTIERTGAAAPSVRLKIRYTEAADDVMTTSLHYNPAAPLGQFFGAQFYTRRVRAFPPCVACCLAASLLVGCAGPQAIKTRRHAELSIGASLLGVLAGGLSIAAFPGEKPILIPITIAFGGLAIASAIVYGVAYASSPSPEPPPAPPAPPDHRPEAWSLTQEAQAAARTGDCERVRILDREVRALDAGVHDVVFARDVAIARCLAP